MIDLLRRVAASTWKEALILVRDRGGLVVLFAMPLLLVLVATVVQDKAMHMLAAPEIRVLLVDRDGGDAGKALESGLASAGVFTVSRDLDGAPATEEAARAAVAKGKWQALLVLQPDTSERTRARASMLVGRLFDASADRPPSFLDLPSPPRPVLHVDPVLTEAYRQLIRNVVGGVLQGFEMRMMMESAAREMGRRAAERVGGPMPEAVKHALESIPASAIASSPLGNLEERVATDQPWLEMPTAVQQNVPAWTIFGMFLIVIPLAGSLIRERRDGTQLRLRVVPGGAWVSLAGKALLFLTVCAAQFALMFAVGMFLLPLLGVAAFDPGTHLPAAVVVGLATAAAAIGFGLAVGAIAGTPEQAAVFGATTAVILGAIGGVMLPLFTMPEPMQRLAEWSPLGWSQRAFLELFLRNATLADVAPRVLRLLAFAGAGMAVALTWSRRRG